ncbi:MAG: GntR family transcriptional regulator [Terriglobia bacterium]
MRSKARNGPRSEGSSARQQAYLHIQRKIAAGQLRAGQPISELALAGELGISRTPIREALGQLAAEGILEQTPNRRAIVVKLTRQDIIDLYELREALEVYAVGKVGRYAVAKPDLDRLQSLAGAVRDLKDEIDRSGKPELDGEQIRRFVAYDLGFHTQLMRLAANARMLRVVNETRLMIRIFAMRRKGHGAALLEKIYQEHSEIVRALAARDPEHAMRILSEHIRNSQRERLDDFDQWEMEAAIRENLPFFFDARRFA